MINKRTGDERNNPKLLTEGDIEKTHFVIKIDKSNNEVYMFLEHNYHGVNPNNVVNYFKKFYYSFLAKNGHKRDSSIIHLIIPRNDFMKELERITRTRLAEVYFEKKLLGSNALEFSDRTISLKNELKLVATASPRESITEFVVDCYNKFKERKNSVTKVRVYGIDEDNNEVILDTSFMSKVEFVTVDINQNTGEVNTVQLHTGLKRIANNL